ncbi:ExbD/TolR family protein [Halarsenatibacter silvermanii]|uniref:Outer membrane transport energization protein ExbD n=1 Tax=Halarsenatibacter silvermanii TaxID=321763 RepID=A0A1G9P050_9FIRM|nr:biopolymer transporter ExbD [Halarsenatibacter silvermanii]SDL92029.1 outer membrane transport energization protein ExbD [Halarsenatibacter silvermanii]
MKKMLKTSHDNKSSINILPLIDVIFFLLVFFMLFTTFRASPEGLDLQLPSAETVVEQPQENIVVNIDEQGQYSLEGDIMSLDEIRAEVRNTALEDGEIKEDLVVVINADENVSYQYLIHVMDGLRQEGIYNLALAAEREI